MKKLFALFVFVFLLSIGGAALAEQRAFALIDPVTLYTKMDENSKSYEVSLPDNGVIVPSASRDKQNRLWYKVTVNGKTGWLFHEGIRLRMGPKSKFAANAYKRCASIRAKAVKGSDKSWSKGEAIGDIVTYTGKGALFQTQNGKDLYFKVTGSKASKDVLGFDAIGMSWEKLRARVGTPTVRETPAGDSDARIISYEASGSNMTLAFHVSGDDVEWFEIYRGKTGEATDDIEPDALYEREQI